MLVLRTLLTLTTAALAVGCPKTSTAPPPETAATAPPSEPNDLAIRGEVVENLHGTDVADPYRWMEDEGSEVVTAWTAERNAAFAAYTDGLSEREFLYKRFQHLWRYDDEQTPSPCLLGDRSTWMTKKADQDKWVVHIRADKDAEARVLLDPNTWAETETLSGFYPSPDCSWVAYGVANAGDENPVLKIMNIDTGELLSDTLQGWKQGGVSWMHDNSGFYYSARPLEGERGGGDHNYFHRAWYHALNTTKEADVLELYDDEVKERWHGVYVSEDGKYRLYLQGVFNKNNVWIEPIAGGERVALADQQDWRYNVSVYNDRIYIVTDWEAPNQRVMVTTIDKPNRVDWTEFLPEAEDKLDSFGGVNGHFYARYQHNATTRIDVYTEAGERLHEVALPTVGSASMSGWWAKPETELYFSSFHQPGTTYTYDVEANSTTLLKASPIDIDPTGIVVEQIWYPSKDGTKAVAYSSAPPVPLYSCCSKESRWSSLSAKGAWR